VNPLACKKQQAAPVGLELCFRTSEKVRESNRRVTNIGGISLPEILESEN
jgi:hypothetical protein